MQISLTYSDVLPAIIFVTFCATVSFSVLLYYFLFCAIVYYSVVLFSILLHSTISCFVCLLCASVRYAFVLYASLFSTLNSLRFLFYFILLDSISHFIFYILCNYLGAQSYLCLCPFHEDRNPSCSISDDKGNKLCLEFLCILIVIEV